MMLMAATVMLASLAGSLHCAGMCGPLVAVVQGGNRAGLHLAYQAGRLLTYSLLGFVAGVVGHGVDSVASARGLEHAAAIVGGLGLLLVTGARLSNRASHAPSVTKKVLAKILAQHHPAVRAMLFGAGTGLLPCGWLYAWLSVAAAAGSPEAGAVVMLAFGLGSVPALALANVLTTKLSQLVRFRVPRLAPLVLVAAGFVALATRGTVVASLHRALEAQGQNVTVAPLVCHGG